MKDHAIPDVWLDELTSAAVRANTERSETAHSAHVPASVSPHARADEGEPKLATGGYVVSPVYGGRERGCELVVPLSPVAFKASDEFMAWLEYERQAVDQLENRDPFRDAVSAELVACTLGQRRHADRLELRTDLKGQVLHAAQVIRRALHPVRFLLSAPGGDRTPDHPRVRRMLYR